MDARIDQLRRPRSARSARAAEAQDNKRGLESLLQTRAQEPGDGERRNWWVSPRDALLQDEEGECMMSGALPVENESTDELFGATASNLNILSQLVAGGPTHQADARAVEARGPTISSTRTQVITRIRQEEADSGLSLRDPDRVRKGSCSGFTISQMLMMRINNEDVVLPNLGSIEKHDIRSLKAWLIDQDLLKKSPHISRTEKLLHCLQLLKTGNRYESIAVMFSRSPWQVKEACLDVMRSLLKMYDMLEDESREEEVEVESWGIWKRFDRNAGERAQMYYGFSWSELAQGLVALDLFLGLLRSGTPPPIESETDETNGAIAAATNALEKIGGSMSNGSRIDVSRADT